MPLITPLALLGLLFVPAVDRDVPAPAAARGDSGPVDPALAAARRRRRGERALAAPPAEPAVPAPAAARRHPRPARGPAVPGAPGRARPRHRARRRHLGEHGRDGPPAEPPGRGEAGGDRRAPRAADRRQGQRVEAGRTARIVAAGSTDLGRIRLAIESIQPTSAPGDLGDALALASELAAQSGDAEVLVATDAALATVPHGQRRRAGPRAAGRDREGGSRNQAIVALAVRTAPSGVTRSVFVSIANLDVASRAAPARALGRRAAARVARRRHRCPAAGRRDHRRRRRRRGGRRGPPRGPRSGRARAPPDLLAADDRAWAIVPPDREREILLVGDGDPFLETALSYLPNTALFGVKPDRYPQDARRTDGTDWDLIIFEDFVPAELPASRRSSIAPTGPARSAPSRGSLEDPGIASLLAGRADPAVRRPDDDPHLRGGRAGRCRTGLASVIPGPKGAPLLYAGVRANVPSAVLAFEPRNSDLPLQVAFPILIANLTGELMGGSAAPTDALTPGDPVSLPLAGGATGLRVERPDGSVVDLAPGHDRCARRVTFAQTDLLGVYTATPVFPDAAGGLRRRRIARPRRLARRPAHRRLPGRAGGRRRRPDGSGPVRGRPVRRRRIVDRARQAGRPREARPAGSRRPGHPGASPVTGPAAADRPPARDELWLPIVLIVLVGLCVEWALYHRDVVVRGWRSLTRSRLARPRPDGAPDGHRVRRAAGAAAARPCAGADRSRCTSARGGEPAWAGGGSRSSSGRFCCRRSCSRWPASGSSCRSIASRRCSSSTCRTASARADARTPWRSSATASR